MPITICFRVCVLLVASACFVACGHTLEPVDREQATLVVTRAPNSSSSVYPGGSNERAALLRLENKTKWNVWLTSLPGKTDGPFRGGGPCGGEELVAEPGAMITPYVVSARAMPASTENIQWVTGYVIVPPGQQIRLRVPARYLKEKLDNVVLEVMFDWQVTCDQSKPVGGAPRRGFPWREVNRQVSVHLEYRQEVDSSE